MKSLLYRTESNGLIFQTNRPSPERVCMTVAVLQSSESWVLFTYSSVYFRRRRRRNHHLLFVYGRPRVLTTDDMEFMSVGLLWLQWHGADCWPPPVHQADIYHYIELTTTTETNMGNMAHCSRLARRTPSISVNQRVNQNWFIYRLVSPANHSSCAMTVSVCKASCR